MKKKLLVVGAIVLILVAVFVGNVVYRMYHPRIIIGVNRGPGMESIGIIVAPTLDFIPSDIESNLIEIIDWNNLVVSELSREAQKPRDIRVSGEVKDGKTTLRYEGTYTTKDGETKEYFEEKTFDFVLVPDEELLKH